ncbi:MAG TPA: class F sortase [Acidimicrobiales bacterium]|nr:class F sortase [Acidimicrobiales bacterium]
MTTTGSSGANRGRRRLRAAVDIAAAAMIAAGAVLAGIAVNQHQHYSHAIAAEAARKAQVDLAAELEAQRFRATAQSQSQQGPQSHRAPPPRHPGVSTKLDQGPMAKTPQLRAVARVPAASHHAAAGPTRRQSSPARATRAAPMAATVPGAVSEIQSTGATLVIPALQVRAPVVATGAVDGSMTIPADVHIVGWYDGTDTTGGTTTSAPTPWPGQAGVSLLAGHINWVGQGPGALYYIGQLVVGDPVEVIGSNGVATYWRVSQPPITTPKADLPADLFVNTGPPKLALVTCGGPFDSATGHYLDNVIVWTTLAVR